MIEESFIDLSTTNNQSKTLSFEGEQISVRMWKGNMTIQDTNTTSFGYVFSGKATLNTLQGEFTIKNGMYFSIPGAAQISGDAEGLLVTQTNYNGFFHIGGPVENKGRLRYIDGCTDSLLIAPPVLGDPCLNLLHIPKGTFQTQHTHPSLRAGIIISGYGTCITPDGTYKLKPGLSFVIPPDAIHSFRTESNELLVLAYHPDSDFGPSHQDHPMINRTIIEQA